MKNPSLHQRAGHALVMLTLVALGTATAGCDDDRNSVSVSRITMPSSFHAEATISPSLVGLTPLSGFDCSGFAFGTSFNLIVAANAQDVTMNSVTLHLLDGTNLGGPSVTIPSPQLNAQFGSTFVRAGTNRVFPLQPVFACVGREPHSLTATVFVRDQHGAQQTLTVTAVIR